ncbi:MAG TPA: proline--tRNA ligase, partial [Thermoplasmatales archaeon]|nr:proline--tRNA ligase [Thermoplasmatales archaeon]
IEEARKYKGYIVELPWCGNKDCAIRMEEELDMKTLGEPLDKVTVKDKCASCDKNGVTIVRLAKTY